MLVENNRLWALIIILSCSFQAASGQLFPILRFQKFYGTKFSDNPTSLIKTEDGNLVIAGSHQVDSINALHNGWVAKISPIGKLLWKQSLGAGGYDEIRDLVATPDSGFFFCGVTGSNLTHFEKGDSQTYADFWVGKIDKSGNLIWQKSLGGMDQDIANGITTSIFGGPVVTGSTWSTNFDLENNDTGLNNQWLVILNKDGEVIRNLTYGGNRNDFSNSIIRCKDGGYAQVGFTNSESMDSSKSKLNGDVWISKMDFTGNILWKNVLKEPYEDILTKVIENQFGFLIAVGSTLSTNKNKQFWIVKFDQSGRVILNKKYGDSGFEHLTSVAECTDGGIIVCGYSSYNTLENQYIKGGEDFWVIRLDAQGDIVWKKTFGGPNNERATAIIEYKSGVYYVLGSKINTFEKDLGKNNTTDFWLLRIDERDCSEMKPRFTIDVPKNVEKMGVPIRFKNMTAFAESYLWNFGDGSISNQRSPQKIYDSPGVYQVRLTVFANETCYQTFVYPDPIIIY